MAAPRLLVTRPAREAARWVQALAAQGVAADALPLIEIVPAPMAGALAEARAQMERYGAVMFVSGNAVDGFFLPQAGQALTGAAAPEGSTRAWSPGPGTTAALHRAGWPSDRIDEPAPDAPQFDSEALWAQVQAQVHPGMRVLIVRGGDAAGQPAGRDWLAAQLRAAGAAVDEAVAYRRVPPVLDAASRQRAAAMASDGTVWLFSSSEAIANLCQCLPGQVWSAARALTTHPRIARAAREAGFGHIVETRPTLDAVVASIESLA